MKVKMLKTTNYEGLKQAGEVYEVDEAVAKRWYRNGIATVKKEELEAIVEETPVVEEEAEDGIRDSGGTSDIPLSGSGDIAGKLKQNVGKSKRNSR